MDLKGAFGGVREKCAEASIPGGCVETWAMGPCDMQSCWSLEKIS